MFALETTEFSSFPNTNHKKASVQTRSWNSNEENAHHFNGLLFDEIHFEKPLFAFNIKVEWKQLNLSICKAISTRKTIENEDFFCKF